MFDDLCLFQMTMEATLLKFETVYSAIKHILQLTCPNKNPLGCNHQMCAYLRMADGSNKLLDICTSFLALMPNETILCITKNRGHPITCQLALAAGVPHADILRHLPPCTLFTIENTRVTLSFTPVEEGLCCIYDEQRLTVWQPDDKFTNFENR